MITALWVIGSILYVLLGLATAARWDKQYCGVLFDDEMSLFLLTVVLWPIFAAAGLSALFFCWVRDL